MKSTLLFILISSATLGQIEKPFPLSHGAAWLQTLYLPDNTPFGSGPGEYYEHPITTDTSLIDTINNLEYMPVLEADYNLDIENCLSCGEWIGYYRIDGKKVYYLTNPYYTPTTYFSHYTQINFDSQDEILLYDFDLQVNDTFSLDIVGTLRVESVDSIQINGQYHKRINFADTSYYDWFGGLGDIWFVDYFWIEGIGSKFGFFPKFNQFEQYMIFHCFHQVTVPYQIYDSYYANGSNCDLVGYEELELPNKQLIRVVDLIGRDIEIIPNTPLIYIYQDGTTEKVFLFE